MTVGSNSNVGEHGVAAEEGRAAIWEVDPRNGRHRIFASGLRNPNGLAWEPVSGALWTTVNERDEIGSDLVPDYLTSVKDGAFYGWPWSYFGDRVDTRADAIVDVVLGPEFQTLASPEDVAVALAPAAWSHGFRSSS